MSPDRCTFPDVGADSRHTYAVRRPAPARVEESMGTMIPLGDASRRPLHRSVVTAVIILVNALVFVLELQGGEPFVTRWSAIPADIVAGHHWMTLLTAMFMQPAGRISSATWCSCGPLVPKSKTRWVQGDTWCSI